mmetsp:Transcript_1423/g.1826  ORF Transcript_1423/g.1826 Transcript_1423/m.1826 type:complete len:321 (-) Transcript_1423:1212-2174(-)
MMTENKRQERVALDTIYSEIAPVGVNVAPGVVAHSHNHGLGPPPSKKLKKSKQQIKRQNGKYGRTKGLFQRRKDTGEFSLLPMPVCSSQGSCDLDCCKEGSELLDPSYIEKLRDKARQVHELDKGNRGLDNYLLSCLRVRSTSDTQGNAFAHLSMLSANKKVRCSYCRTIPNLPPSTKPHNFGSTCPNYTRGKREIGKKLPYYVEYVLPSRENSRSRLHVSKSFFMRLFIIGAAKMSNLVRKLHSEPIAGKRKKGKGGGGGEEPPLLDLPPQTVEDEITQNLRATIAKQKTKIGNQAAEIKKLKATLHELIKELQENKGQ